MAFLLIRITCGLMCLCNLHQMLVAQALAQALAPSDERIRYVGRWDFSDPSKPWCAWQGSSIQASFRGSEIHASLSIGQTTEWIRVIVDGRHVESKMIRVPAGTHKVQLASGLKPGQHRVEIVKETHAGPGRMKFLGFHLPSGRLTKSQVEKPRLKIEFYGDSNLAGSSLEHEKNNGSPEFRGSHFCFAGIASRMLGAEYHNLSFGGAKIAGGINSGMSFYNRLDFYEASPEWDFDRFPADICVVNLGANDVSSKSSEQIRRDYKTLIKALRKEHPSAQIVLMNGYGWSRDEPANYTQQVVDELGDRRLSRVVFPWLFNEWHGCEYDHAGMARHLVAHLAALNEDWKPIRLMDVMDGFGRDGDVANGSFEHVTPFGGYGWRYFTDGAQRIHDPDESSAGEWHLRLPPGKEVHQPSPAQPSHRYTIRLKMRGQRPNDQANIRIEFRDQQWRNEIPNSGKDHLFPVSSEWRDYSLTVDSPQQRQPSDPTRDPWQIIIRLQSKRGSIDIDDVRLNNEDR